MIVVVAPAPRDHAPKDYAGKDHAGMGQTIKHFFAEAFVAKLAIEASDEAVLRWFAGGDIVPGNTALILPFQDRPTGQLAAIVTDNGLWLSVEPDQTIQLAGDALS